MSLLETNGVTKAFGGIQALAGCGVRVEQGEIAGLIGPNGSGKTTLFNVITGYEKADAGAVFFNGQAITNTGPGRVFDRGIGRTFQLTRIFPRLTVMENLHVAARRKGLGGILSHWTNRDERQNCLELLDFVGLAHLSHLQAGALSFGQKKLVEFATILVARPKVILLDEPAGGINPTLILHLADRIRELNKDGITFLIVEHNMGFVMGLCDRVTVMHRGAVIAQGPPDIIRQDPAVLEAYLGD